MVSPFSEAGPLPVFLCMNISIERKRQETSPEGPLKSDEELCLIVEVNNPNDFSFLINSKHKSDLKAMGPVKIRHMECV